MKIPKKIKIGGHFLDVIFPYVFTERGDMAGDINFEKKIIRLTQKDFSDSSIIVTFIHEILHCIDYLTGHNIFTDNDDGEGKIEALSEGIYQVLVDNGYLKINE